MPKKMSCPTLAELCKQLLNKVACTQEDSGVCARPQKIPAELREGLRARFSREADCSEPSLCQPFPMLLKTPGNCNFPTDSNSRKCSGLCPSRALLTAISFHCCYQGKNRQTDTEMLLTKALSVSQVNLLVCAWLGWWRQQLLNPWLPALASESSMGMLTLSSTARRQRSPYLAVP